MDKKLAEDAQDDLGWFMCRKTLDSLANRLWHEGHWLLNETVDAIAGMRGGDGEVAA
jgi:hypothetical protein